MDAEFKSINKVVTSIVEEGKLKEYWTESEPISEIRCWFDPNDAFEDMYENNAIRVIAISLNSKSSSITITHQKLISAFNDKMLIVTFPKKSFLQIPEPTENQLGYLCISTALKNSLFNRPFHPRLNRPFHPRRIEICNDPELVSAILEKQVVAQKIEKTIDKTKII